MTHSNNDCFLLGKAWLSFRIGDVDMGIHILLPTTDGRNAQFTELFVLFDALMAPTAEQYATTLAEWARTRGYEISPEDCF